MFFNLIFLGKDEETKEDKAIFDLDGLKISLEVLSDKKKYFFTIKKGNEKLKEFSISDKKLGNNKPAIEIKSLFYNVTNEREELILNLGYNGSTAFIHENKDGVNIELINPIGETIKDLFYFYEELSTEE